MYISAGWPVSFSMRLAVGGWVLNRLAQFRRGCTIHKCAVEGDVHGTGDGMAEGGLPYSRNAFDQQVSTGKDGDQRHAHDLIFAADDRPQGSFELRGLVRRCRGGRSGHEHIDFTRSMKWSAARRVRWKVNYLRG